MKTVFVIAAVGLIVTNVIVIYKLNEVQAQIEPLQEKLMPIADDIQNLIDKIKGTGLFG